MISMTKCSQPAAQNPKPTLVIRRAKNHGLIQMLTNRLLLLPPKVVANELASDKAISRIQ